MDCNPAEPVNFPLGDEQAATLGAIFTAISLTIWVAAREQPVSDVATGAVLGGEVKDHFGNWMACCRAKGRPSSGFRGRGF